MKKILIYLRVSDPNQEVRDSLNKQEEQVLRYCQYKEYNIYKVIKEVGSGRRNDREGFQELEEEISNNTFDVLVFYELSRLARNSYLLHNLIHSLRVKKISFESVQEPFLNSDSPTSKAMLGFMAGFAEMESDKTRERVSSRMKHYTEQGYFLFRPPHGYDLADNILVKNKYANEIIDIFNKFNSGTSYMSLQKEYNFSHTKIKGILTNKTYLGYVKFGFHGRDKDTGKRFDNGIGEYYEGLHLPIITKEAFDIAQIIVENKQKNRFRAANGEYLLSGLLKHHECDCKMYAKRKKHKVKGKVYIYTYYQCPLCGRGSVKQNSLEDTVIQTMKEYCKKLKNLDNKKPSKKVLNTEKNLEKLKGKRKRIINTYLDELITRDEYLDLLKEIDIKISNMKKSEEKVNDSEPTTSYKTLMKLFKGFDKKDNVEKHNFLKMVIEEVRVIDKNNIEILFKV